MIYLDLEGIKSAFAEHLMIHCYYSQSEAAVAVSDFPDPYSNCYLNEEFVGNCTIDGENYGQYSSYTSLWRAGISDVPEFCFYTYYRRSDIPNNTVGEYMNAKKLYQIDNLDKSDFPSFESEDDFEDEDEEDFEF